MRKIYLLLVVLLLLGNILKAQNRTISGVVLDEKNLPLPGVTVQVKGSTAATVTDANGKYTLQVTNLQNVVISVNFIGYGFQSKTLRVGEKNADFTLAPNSKDLDEVKDQMTYKILPLTYNAYLDELPTLTDAQNLQIKAWLIEAREHAIDAESSEKKHAWFGKYKGRINNYLSAQGFDMKKAAEEWQKRIQSKQQEQKG